MDVVSFTINHDKLKPGIYVSRKDKIGAETVTTFDIRMKISNIEPVMDNPAIHTLEHLFAVFLRGKNSDWADKIIYIGPMGCRTGMYMIIAGDLEPSDVLELVKHMFKFVVDFDAPIPATTSVECGNYLDHNLAFAKWEAKYFYTHVLSNMKEENMIYPI